MQIKTLAVGQLSTNCYLTWNEENDECVIIDPGGEGDYISEEILKEKLRPIAIVLTHGHFDHMLAVIDLKLNFGLKVWMNKKDEFLYKQAGKSAKYWTGEKPGPIAEVDHDLKEGGLSLGGMVFRILETPGHTPGSISLYVPDEGIAFTGDTLFKEDVGRTDFRYADDEELWKSIKQRLFKLPEETKVYSGHGEETTIGQEKEAWKG